MKKYLNLYKSKFCSLLWLLLGFEALVVIYLLSPAPIDPLVVLEPDFASIKGDNILYEEGKPARYTVAVSKNLDKELHVTLAYGGGAVRGVDYKAPSVVVIKKGDMNTTFEITSFDDNEREGEELFSVKISKIEGTNFMEPLRPQDLGGVVYTKLLDEPKHGRKVHKPDFLSISCVKTLREDNATALCHIKSTQTSYEDLNVSLQYGGSATLGEDYDAPSSVLLAQGTNEVVFKIYAIDDAYKEGMESIEISVNSVEGGGFEESTFDDKLATIDLNDEATSTQVTTLSINNIDKIEEGGEGTYTLELSRAPIHDLTVYLKRNEGAKKFDIPEKVVFKKGEQQKQFKVVSVDDNIKEKDDFIEFSIAKVQNSSFERLSYTNSALKTKVIDEVVPVEPDNNTAFITVTTESAERVFDETSGDVVILVKTTAPLEQETTFRLKLQKISSQGRDYRLEKSVTIKKGENSGQTLLHVIDNNVKQSEDRFKIFVDKHSDSGLEDLRSKKPLELTVSDDTSGAMGAEISLSCPEQLYENNKTVLCILSMTQRSFQDVHVTLNYMGSATFSEDYNGPKTLTLAKGKKRLNFKITSRDDVEKEATESILPTIVTATENYFERLNVVENSKSLRLVDEKRPSQVVYLTLSVHKEVQEGSATPMTLSLSVPALKDVTVMLHMPKSKDYVAVEQVIIPKGAKEITFDVTSVNDNIKEQRSYLPVSIKKVEQEGFEKVSFDKRTHRVLIVDDANVEEAATLTFKVDNSDIYEDDKPVSVLLQLSQPAQKDMKISLKSSGEAKLGVDYKMPSSVVLQKGKKEISFKIRPLNDNVIENPETLSIVVGKHQDGGLERIASDASVSMILHDDHNATHSPAAQVSLKGPSKVAEPKRSKPYTLSLSQKAAEDMTVYLRYEGEATDKDYLPVKSVIIKKGSKTAGFSIETLDNDEVQPIRHFSVSIERIEGGGLENAQVGKRSSVKTKITDNADIDAAFNSIVKEQIIKFEVGSTEVGEDAKKTLDKIAELFRKFPSARLTVEGHTNNLGSAAFNLVLSQKRANSIKRYLVSKDIEAKRIRAIGYGESRPLLNNSSKEAMEFNKRVEFKVVY